MSEEETFLHIEQDHPWYERIMRQFGYENPLDPAQVEADTAAREAEVDWNALIKDYSELRTQGVMSFLVFGERLEHKLRQALARRGLAVKADYQVFVMPVLSVESMAMIGGAPTEEIPEGEFADYACVKGKLEPDSEDHPHISEMEKAIPIRSNRHLTSDSLPMIRGLNQVYILKLSSKVPVALRSRGRPKKKRK